MLSTVPGGYQSQWRLRDGELWSIEPGAVMGRESAKLFARRRVREEAIAVLLDAIREVEWDLHEPDRERLIEAVDRLGVRSGEAPRGIPIFFSPHLPLRQLFTVKDPTGPEGIGAIYMHPETTQDLGWKPQTPFFTRYSLGHREVMRERRRRGRR